MSDEERHAEVIKLGNAVLLHVRNANPSEVSVVIDALALALGKIVKDSPIPYDVDQVALLVRRCCIPEGSVRALRN
jgi:hypothetical protein